MVNLDSPFSESRLYVPAEQKAYKVVEDDFIFNESRKPQDGPKYHMFGQGTYVFFELDGALNYMDNITGDTQRVASFRLATGANFFDYTGRELIEGSSFVLTDEILKIYAESVSMWVKTNPYSNGDALIEDVKRVSRKLGRLIDHNELMSSQEKYIKRDSRAVFSLFLERLGYSGIAFYLGHEAGNIWDLACLEFEGFLDEEFEL